MGDISATTGNISRQKMFYCFLREQLKNDLDEIVSISRLWAAK